MQLNNKIRKPEFRLSPLCMYESMYNATLLQPKQSRVLILQLLGYNTGNVNVEHEKRI